MTEEIEKVRRAGSLSLEGYVSPQENLKKVAYLVEVKEILETFSGAVIIEDEHGQKYELSKILMVGRATTDPGLVLRIKVWNG